MKGFSLILVLVALVQWSSGYSAYDRDTVHRRAGLNYDQQQTVDFPDATFEQDQQQTVDSSFSDAAFDLDQQQTKVYDLPTFDSVGSQEYSSSSSGNGVEQNNYPTTGSGNGFEQHVYTTNDNYPTTGSGLHNWESSFNFNKPTFRLPETTSTLTVRRYNRTVITTGDRTVVTGSNSHKEWLNGNLVYDSNSPLTNVNNWKHQEYENLKKLIADYGITPKEYETSLVYNRHKLDELANKHNVPRDEVEELLQNAYKNMKNENLFNVPDEESQKDNNDEWRINVINMLKEHSFTPNDFEQWASEDLSKPNIPNPYSRVVIDELIKGEEAKYKALGLLAPKLNPNKWQKILGSYLKNITEKECQSFDELEQRLKENRGRFENLATNYHIQIDQIDSWAKNYLARLLKNGQLKINDLSAWQVLAQKLLYKIFKENPQCSLEQLDQLLENNRYNINAIAFHHHKTAKDVEDYIRNLTEPWRQQGKLNFEIIKVWMTEQKRIFDLLLNDYETALDIVEKENLIQQYNSNVDRLQEYVQKVVDDLTENTLYADLAQWQTNEFNLLDKSISQINFEIQRWNQLQKANADELLDRNNVIRKKFQHQIGTTDTSLVSLIENYNEKVNEIQKRLRPQIAELTNTDFLDKLRRNLEVRIDHESNQQDHTYQHDVEFIAKILTNKLLEFVQQYQNEVTTIEKWFAQELRKLQEKYSHSKFDILGVSNWQTSQVSEIEKLLKSNTLKVKQLASNLFIYNTQVNQLIKEIEHKTEEITKFINAEVQRLQSLGTSKIHKELNNLPKVERIVYSKHLDKVSIVKLKYKIEQLSGNLDERKKYVDNIKVFIDNEIQKTKEQSSLHFEPLHQLQTELKDFLATCTGDSDAKVQEFLNREQRIFQDFYGKYDSTVKQYLESNNQYQQELNHLLELLVQKEEKLKQWRLTQVSYLDYDSEYIKLIELITPERHRLETSCSHDSLINIDDELLKDYKYLENLATQYHINVDLLKNWQRQELLRIQKNVRLQITLENIKNLIEHNGFNYDDSYNQFIKNYQVLLHLANTNNLPVKDFKKWIEIQLQNLKRDGYFLRVQNKLSEWQKKIRDTIRRYIEQYHTVTVLDLQLKLKIETLYLNYLAVQFNVDLSKIYEWVERELDSLKFLGIIKDDKLNDWKQTVINRIIFLLQTNYKLTIEELREKLEHDSEIIDLGNKHNGIEIKNFISNLCKRLQDLGKLNNWQSVVRQYIRNLVLQHNLTPKLLREKLENSNFVFSLANEYGLTIAQVGDFIDNEICLIKDLGLLDVEVLNDWQTEWRYQVIQLLKNHDLNVEQFKKWLLQHNDKLQHDANQYHITFEEMNEFIRNEILRLLNFGALRPIDRPTQWQLYVIEYLDNIFKKPCASVPDFEQRLRDTYLWCEELAKKNGIDVKYIRSWLEAELASRFVQGQLQINYTTPWKLVIENHFRQILTQQKYWTLEDLKQLLKLDVDFKKMIAFQYHLTLEQIEEYIQTLVHNLPQQDEINSDVFIHWNDDKQHLIDLLEPQYAKLIRESLQEKDERKKLDHILKEYIASANRETEFLETLKETTRKTDILESLKTYEKTLFKHFHSYQTQFELETPHKQIVGLIKGNDLNIENRRLQFANSNKILQTATTTHKDEVKRLLDYFRNEIDNASKIDFNDESVKDFSTWTEREEQYLPVNTHDSHHAAQDFEIKKLVYHKKLNQLAQDYNSKLNQLVQQSNADLEDLQKRKSNQLHDITEFETTQNESFENLIRKNQLMLSEIQSVLLNDQMTLTELFNKLHQDVAVMENSNNQKGKHLEILFEEKINQELRKLHALKYECLIISSRQSHLTVHDLSEEIEKIYLSLKDLQKRVEQIQNYNRDEVKKLIDDSSANFKSFYDSKTLVFENWLTSVKQHKSEALLYLNRDKDLFDSFLQKHITKIENLPSLTDVSIKRSQKFLNGVVALKREYRRNVLSFNNDLKRITELLNSERHRLENIFKTYSGAVSNIYKLMANDYYALQNLANNNNIPLHELGRWQNQQLEHLISEARLRIVQDYIKNLIAKYAFTLDDIEREIANNDNRLEDLAQLCNVPAIEFPGFLREEINKLKQKGFFNNLENKLPEWQHQERQRLQYIIERSRPTQEDLDLIFQIESSRLANNHNLQLPEIKNALSKEYLRLKYLEEIHPEEHSPLKTDLKSKIINLLQNNKLTVDDLEQKLLNDPQQFVYWQDLYNVDSTEIENLIKKQCEILKSLNLDEIQITHINRPDDTYISDNVFKPATNNPGISYEDWTSQNNFNVGNNNIQEFIKNKLNNHEEISMEEITNLLRQSSSSSSSSSSFQLSNFGQQQQSTYYKYNAQQPSPVDIYINKNDFQLQDFDQQQLPVDKYVNQNEFQLQDFNQQQDQTDYTSDQPQYELEDFAVKGKTPSSSYKH